VVWDFSLLMLGIRWFVGKSAEQGDITLPVSFVLHFNFIFFPGPYLLPHATRTSVLFSEVIRKSDRQPI